jgi:hypothetical protein
MADGSKILLLIISTALVTADRTIRRLHYKLDGDITSFEGGNAIIFESTFIDSDASSLEIETEQWVHDYDLEITAPPHLHIYVKQSTNYYPKITAYLRLHKPLSAITLAGASILTTVNSLITDTLSLQLAGSSKAHVTLEINSRLYASVSDAAKLFINGFVKDTGYVYVSGAGKVNAFSCPMNIVIADVKGAGIAYVIGQQAVDINTSGSGKVYYRGPLRKKTSNNFSWINSLFSFDDITSKTSNKSMSYFFMLFFIIVVFLL